MATTANSCGRKCEPHRKCPNCSTPRGRNHVLKPGLTVITTDGRCLHKPKVSIVNQTVDGTPFKNVRFVFYKAKTVMNLMSRFFKTTSASIKRLILLFKHIGEKYPIWRVLKYRDLRAMVVYIAAAPTPQKSTTTTGTQTDPEDPNLILEPSSTSSIIVPFHRPMSQQRPSQIPRPATQLRPQQQIVVIHRQPQTNIQRCVRATTSITVNFMYTVSTILFSLNNILRSTSFLFNNLYRTGVVTVASTTRITAFLTIRTLRATTLFAGDMVTLTTRTTSYTIRHTTRAIFQSTTTITTATIRTIASFPLATLYVLTQTNRAISRALSNINSALLKSTARVIITTLTSIAYITTSAIRTIAQVPISMFKTTRAIVNTAGRLTTNTSNSFGGLLSRLTRIVAISIFLITSQIILSTARITRNTIRASMSFTSTTITSTIITSTTFLRNISRLFNHVIRRYPYLAPIPFLAWQAENIANYIWYSSTNLNYLATTLLSQLYMLSPLYIPLNYAYYLYRDLVPQTRPRAAQTFQQLPRYQKIVNKRTHIFLKLIILYTMYHYQLGPIGSYILHLAYRGVCLIDYYRLQQHQQTPQQQRTLQPYHALAYLPRRP